MPIEDRNVEAGTVLTARYKKQDRTCEVIETDDGLRFKLDTGELYRSPSSAGKAAMDGVACNGWRFWSIAGSEKPKREPKPKAEKPAKPAKKAGGKKGAKAKGTPARQRAVEPPSYGCGGCGATFGSQKAAVAHALTHSAN
jgi:hypothetical protein